MKGGRRPAGVGWVGGTDNSKRCDRRAANGACKRRLQEEAVGGRGFILESREQAL